MRWMVHTGVAATAVAAVLAGALRGQTGPAESTDSLVLHPEIALPATDRYTPLTGVTFAAVGPDERLWLTMGLRQMTVEQCKAEVAQEFGQHQPQLPALFPVLFEPSGRVWFYMGSVSGPRPDSSGGMLLGYDGQEFVERRIEADRAGGFYPGLGNGGGKSLVADGCAFFAVNNTVLTYARGNWSSRDLAAGEAPYGSGGIRLFPGYDKGDVLAATGSGELWRYHAAGWSRLPTPPNPNGGRGGSGAIVDVAANGVGVWTLSSQGLHFIAWGADGPRSVKELIAQLEAPDFAGREAATNALIEEGNSVEAELTAALKKYQQSDAKYRIEHILAAVSANNHTAPATSVLVGGYRVEQPSFLHRMADGSALLGAIYVVPEGMAAKVGGLQRDSISSQELEHRGVLAIDAAGAVTYRGGKDLFDLLVGSTEPGGTFNMNVLFNPLHLVTLPIREGREEWIAGTGPSDTAVLVDCATDKVIKRVTVPFRNFPTLAVGEDLLVYSAGGMMAVRPDAASPAKPVTPVFSAVEPYPNHTETEDGGVWFIMAGGMTVVDGNKRTALPEAKLVVPQTAMIGGQDAVVAQANERWYFITRTGVAQADLLEDLILQNRAAFAKSFAGRRRSYGLRQSYFIQADRAGNIWLAGVTSRALKVLVGDQWIDAAGALSDAGSPTGHADLVLPVGDGSKVYVADTHSDARRPRFPNAFLASVEEGRIVLKPAGASPLPESAVPAVYTDSKGGLWFMTRSEDGTKMGAVRMTEAGASPLTEGRLGTIDADDHAWIYRPATKQHPGQTLVVALEGRDEVLPTIPFSLPGAPIVALANRHVLVPTAIGVQDFHPAGGAADPQFELGTLWDLGAPDQRSLQGSFSTNEVHVADQVQGSYRLRFYNP